MNRRTGIAFAVALLWCLCAAGVPAETTQQNKMKECNTQADAKGLAGEGKGEARRAFMKECLASHPKMTQQDKMKQCNQQASAQSLKGDARKTFMSTCLSAK